MHRLLFLGALVTSACSSFTVRSRSVDARGELRAADTRLSGALQTSAFLGLRLEEGHLVPPGVSHAAVRDEVTLAGIGPDVTCFSMVQRTPLAIDQPLYSWNVVVNGEDTTIDHEEEPRVVDYDYLGQRLVASEIVSSRRRARVSELYVTEPAVFRVVERRARFCGSPPADDTHVSLALQLVADGSEAAGGDGWHGYYRWEVQR